MTFGPYNVYTYVVDVLFLYQGQRFVWNAEKASINLAKHGITFEQACEVFSDPLINLEEASDSDEYRDAATGVSEDQTMLFVVHIYREGAYIRIISARPVTARERKSYEDAL